MLKFNADLKTKPIKFVCSHCGSADVRADAYAEWDPVIQDWLVSAIMDRGSVCEKCGDEASLDEVELTGDEYEAATAHKLAVDNGWNPSDEDTAVEFCDAHDLDYAPAPHSQCSQSSP